MANKYGPWATLIDIGGNPQLSAFWKRRLKMLVPASKTSPVLSRRNLSLLAAAGILACLLPTVFFTPAAAQEKKPADKLISPDNNDSKAKSLPADFLVIPVSSYNDLQRETTRKELKISGEQEKILQDICDNYEKQLRIMQGNTQKEFENLTPEERLKKQRKWDLKYKEDIKHVRNQINELLTAEQLAALKCTAIGELFGRLIFDHNLSKKAGISEEQLKQLTQLDEGEVQKNFKKFDKMRKQNEQKMLAVITPQQWERLEQSTNKSGADNKGLVFMPTNAIPGSELTIVYDPDVQKELALNAEQQTKLESLFEQAKSQELELWKQADNMDKNHPAKEQAAKQAESGNKLQDMNAREIKQIEEVLTPRQFAELKKIALRHNFIQSLPILQNGLGGNKQPGILDRIGASEEQKAELRRLTDENERSMRKFDREMGAEAMKILSPLQQEYLLDELDHLADSGAALLPADAAKPMDEKQSQSTSRAVMNVGNAQGTAVKPPEGADRDIIFDLDSKDLRLPSRRMINRPPVRRPRQINRLPWSLRLSP